MELLVGVTGAFYFFPWANPYRVFGGSYHTNPISMFTKLVCHWISACIMHNLTVIHTVFGFIGKNYLFELTGKEPL